MFTTTTVKEYKPLTASNILELVSEEEIFRHYLGFDFNLKTCYISKLRQDDVSPSLNFYYNRSGSICYKDFGHSQGNCFTFVMNLYGITYKEALERVNFDMNLGLGVKQETNSREKISYPGFKKAFKSENALIQFNCIAFEKEDIDYWNSYGISLETLKIFNVFKAGKIWLNKRLFWVSNPENPIYVYYFPGSKKCKVYRPLAKPYTSASGKKISGKWMTNCDSFDLQGLEQLPKEGEILINTSSLKDVMLFYEMGFSAVAPQGEGHYIPKSIQEHLWTRFKRIITVYDNDTAGVNASIRINADMGSEYWNIPKNFYVKDPTDFYKKYGKEETYNLLKTIK